MKMEDKPIPKPRSILTECPIPAPRTITPCLNQRSSTSSKDSSCSEGKEDGKSSDDVGDNSSLVSGTDFIRNVSSSSRSLKDGISEKVTVKGRAMISSTKNASIRLEKSMKNLLTRRFSSLSQTASPQNNIETPTKSEKMIIGEDRCVSLPVDDVFSTITFYSPITQNLRSVPKEEDLSTARYNPPPPVYPIPQVTVSVYDELQSVTSVTSESTASSARCDTCSSINSDVMDKDPSLDGYDVYDFIRNKARDSDQSLSISVSRLSDERSDSSRKSLCTSESWTYQDTLNHFGDIENYLDRLTVRQNDKESNGRKSGTSEISIENSVYENWTSTKLDRGTKIISPNKSPETISPPPKSLLVEFDPLTSTDDDNVYCNYQSNDFMLLQSLLADDDYFNKTEDNDDSMDEEESSNDEEQINKEEMNDNEVLPPKPPRRYDSLTKNDYDEVEYVESLGKVVVLDKSPVLLRRSQLSKKIKQVFTTKETSSFISTSPECVNYNDTTTNLPKQLNEDKEHRSCTPTKSNEESSRIGNVVQKLKRLKDKDTAIGPHVMNLVKKGSKYLSKNRENRISNEDPEKSQSLNMIKPKTSVVSNLMGHRGNVFIGNGMNIDKMSSRAAILNDQRLSFYSDCTMTHVKEIVDIDSVHSIHLLKDVKTINEQSLQCITLTGEGKTGVHVFYTQGPTERRIWAQRILESLTPVFPTKYTTKFTRAGWAYLKESVTGSWFPAWLLLQYRTLVYTKSLNPVTFACVDLRRARYVISKDQDISNPQSENLPMVVVDAANQGALHIAAPGPKECTAWKYALHQAATNSGPTLYQQQITQDDVPVIIDKCINFIYTHGIMSEGIYRRSGASKSVVRLLESFRQDAWATQITKDLYTEHDVATALRRFLRDLAEPIFLSHVHEELCKISKLNPEEDRIIKYQEQLSELDEVSSATLRRILGHLHCLSQQSAKNLMTINNLSAIWGPTLMHPNDNNGTEEWVQAETQVVHDLIHLYPNLYKLSATDLDKEARILEFIEKHHASTIIPRHDPSGDLKIWIYIMSKEGKCFNVTIGPQKTAFDICLELADKVAIPVHNLCLHESILNGALERPMHHEEYILETVALWGFWDTEDRKNNTLILKEDVFFKEIFPLIRPPMAISGELKFADTKMKNFKNYFFEFTQGKLFCYKDKVYSTKLHEWKIDDLVWYLGHESKRDPHMGWSITFLVKNEKTVRCKEKPYFGYTLAGTSTIEQYKWLAAMLFGQYQMNIRPVAVNLIDT